MMQKLLVEIEDREPYFLLRARDTLAPEVVELWAITAGMRHVGQAKVESARAVAERMREWQKIHGCKVPD